MKFSILLLALPAMSQPQAAAIALIVTPEFLVLAADSGTIEPTCRIRKIGESFYALHNFTRDASTGYDAARLVAGLSSKTVAAQAAELKGKIDAPLKRALAASRARSSAAFNKKFESRIAAGVIFVGFENGKPAVADLTFLIEDLAAGELKLQLKEYYCPGEPCGGGYGFNAEPFVFAKRFAQENRRYWEGSAAMVAAKARAFVNIAIGERPADFAGPISVLTIGSPRPEWTTPGLCKE